MILIQVRQQKRKESFVRSIVEMTVLPAALLPVRQQSMVGATLRMTCCSFADQNITGASAEASQILYDGSWAENTTLKTEKNY